ncbi:hypothetical protein [Paenibacillus thiaminolyticus]|uniref:Uncharacterized protein n=1 Tax=Paenibacillus thiaminolyticus TaxID=49283 RepID=A0A3A3H251_PANTH|nr:hypothetical protein [Paenibacillus thiaminolyticus]RJG23055.1 hypothetical protein DQX05_14330 [Paenibacillus thiaminolyticus]
MAYELEYIFSNILVKDEKTGVYLVNEEELKNSHYTEEEQERFLKYAKQLMNQGDYSLNNTFDKCMQDLLGITSAVWDEIKSYIDAGQYLAAAGAILLAAQIAVNPITIALFVATCGPSSAS